MTGINRRALLAATTTALAMPGIVRAQGTYPNQPIRLIVPWAAGGATDVAVRAIADASSRSLGQPIVVDNRPGAGGTLGALYLATQARPDGYTLSQMPSGVLRLPYMSTSAGFDPLKDFTWISQLSGYTFGIAVRSDSPFRTTQELFDWARANPGKLSYGSPGVITSPHLAMEQIAIERGLELLHVPFRGVAEDIAALLGGSIMCAADGSSWAPLVKDGKFRLLCVWTAQRIRQFPDVPTLRECGIDKVITSPFGIAGPKGMDPAIVAKLDAAFAEALHAPAVQTIFERLDQLPDYLDSAAYATVVRNGIAAERPMLQQLSRTIQR